MPVQTPHKNSVGSVGQSAARYFILTKSNGVHVKSNESWKRYHQLRYFLPFARRRFKIDCPVRVRTRAKKPCRRFCTLRDGLKVFRGAPRETDDENVRLALGCFIPIACRGNSALRSALDKSDEGHVLLCGGWSKEARREQKENARDDNDECCGVVSLKFLLHWRLALAVCSDGWTEENIINRQQKKGLYRQQGLW